MRGVRQAPGPEHRQPSRRRRRRCVTTAPAPTSAPAPILTPAMITAPEPIEARSSTERREEFPVVVCLERPVLRRSARTLVVDEHDAVAHEHLVADVHAVADEGVALDLAAFADHGPTLDLDEGPDPRSRADRAPVEVREGADDDALRRRRRRRSGGRGRRCSASQPSKIGAHRVGDHRELHLRDAGEDRQR